MNCSKKLKRYNGGHEDSGKKDSVVPKNGMGVLPEAPAGVTMEKNVHALEDFGIGGDASADASGAGCAVL